MAKNLKDSKVHTLKIQQTYWAKDSSEEDLLKLGAICLDKVEEQVDYYDTDGYDLAVKDTWLSKTEHKWRLIVGKSGPVKPSPPSKTSQHHLQKGNLKASRQVDNDLTRKNQQKALKNDQNSNKILAGTDAVGKGLSTCHELENEIEIMQYLSKDLSPTEDINGAAMGDFLQVVRIQKYASFVFTKQVTYRLRDLYTITLTTDQKSSRKVAVVSLQVEIQNVTQGFQRLEQLANDLELQLQNM
ncbi:uncharacterized protein LOC134572585 [Pelobates fuscus]|uniref:uncharacterized protein LOC134572585 n=1 Tax=Pelobates fuscus TaxID=191477 RepID=UPI002FE4EB13